MGYWMIYNNNFTEFNNDNIVARYRATWTNGNEPDGETTVCLYVFGSPEEGFIVVCDDNNCGGSTDEAGQEIYPTEEAAIAAAKKYAEELRVFGNGLMLHTSLRIIP